MGNLNAPGVRLCQILCPKVLLLHVLEVVLYNCLIQKCCTFSVSRQPWSTQSDIRECVFDDLICVYHTGDYQYSVLLQIPNVPAHMAEIAKVASWRGPQVSKRPAEEESRCV